ncbi:MAG: DUF494 domain-containing protein [Methylotenera sp.]|nr:DUF494 domain-containing protein [Methylotenera sp.]
MFEVLVFMFENYFSHHSMPDIDVMEQELSAAGFEKTDINGAFDWYQEMKYQLMQPALNYSHEHSGMRIFSDKEIKKINTESIGFVLFLQQANVINDMERDLIVDRAMALKQEVITVEEMRWISMIALWNEGREKDYLFVEDAFFNPRGLTVH